MPPYVAPGPAGRYPHLAVWRERVGVFGLYVFALFALLGQAGAYIGMGFMLLAALADAPRWWQRLWRDPLLWLFVVFAATLTVSTTTALLERPAEHATQTNTAPDMLKLWGFLVVAWWLRGSQRRILIASALGLLGFVLGRVRSLDAGEIEAILNWQRTGLGLPDLAFGQYSAAALLGLIIMAPRIWQWLRRRPAPACWVGALALLLLGVLLLQGVLLSQSRGVWLALVTVTVVLTLIARKHPGHRRDVLARAKPLLAMVVAVVLLVNSPLIAQRFAFGGSDFFENLWAGQFEHIEDFSVQARLMMLELGVRWWGERPWFGWGPGATPHLLRASGNETVATQGYNDLHNVGIDLLVRVGVVGLLPLALGVVVIFQRLRQAHRDGALSRDVYLLIFALLLLHFLCALTNFRVLNTDWRFYWWLFAGAAYTVHLNINALGQRSGDHAQKGVAAPP